ncbi:laccase-14-like [Cryptomeria japonica]|uniref:laccase-14-like n=1 Tax=Cryptomeria japonica TaxID=3369 RepID=UPI0027DA19E0|nr:laccase-14-like [Cryptomeria japonica]
MERWDVDTMSFHVSTGEITVTLIEVYRILRLLVWGEKVSPAILVVVELVSQQEWALGWRVDATGHVYLRAMGVFTTDFPSNPPLVFNYTGDNIPKTICAPTFGTKVKVFNYNDTVQVVYQGTNIFQADDHPMHLHGYDFFVVGQGFGNYNDQTDPLNFNLVDPPLKNTVGVPLSGWAAFRFKADNPGAWFFHCHFDDHLTWGLNTVFVVKNVPSYSSSLEPPPPDLPRC